MATLTTTYLELTAREQLRPVLLADDELLTLQARTPLPAFYRFLYVAVGGSYQWTERLLWSDEQIYTQLLRPSVTLLVLYDHGTPAGFIELDAQPTEPGTEIVYFGLIPAFQGRGLGKHLLSVGVQRAFDDGAERVWLHTDNTDGPYALANYVARGFRPYRVTSEEDLTL